MITYKFKVTIKSRRKRNILEEIIYPERQRKEAMMKVAEINGDAFSDKYAVIETIMEGRDPIAEQTYAFVDRCIARNWQRFRP